jgi:AcrR family transcriptional regulator
MASQEERRAKTRQTIVDAAGALIAKHGFDGTSVENITEAARVAKGTFYQHFDTKLDVLLAVTRHQQDAVMKRVVRSLDKGQPPLEAGLEFVRAMARWCRERGSGAGELLLRALERAEEPQQSSARALLARILEAAQRRGEIRRDVSAEVMATVIAGAMLPAMVYWSRHPEKGDLARWLEQTWRLTLEGALVRREGTR